MRIWSIHPKYLDTKGLVALWRETLLAQNVLLGNTKGYKNHPQLIRFKAQKSPIQAIANYLHYICDEADERIYKFDRNKIQCERKNTKKLEVSLGQLQYEWAHFLKKIECRDNELFEQLKELTYIESHPIFRKVEGEIESWERV